MSETQSRENVINQQITRSIEMEQALYEKLKDLEEQLENVGGEENLKEKVTYTKTKIDGMEEREVIFSIRLAEAEKNWLGLFKTEEPPAGDGDKKFTENMDAKQFYKDKYEQISQEVKKMGEDYAKLEAQMANLKAANEQLSKLNEELTNEVNKLHQGGGDASEENEMKKAIAELTKKNTELMNENNNLLSKNHEIISEHEKCKYILESAKTSPAEIVCSGGNSGSLRLEYENLKIENERLQLLREKIEKALQCYYDNKGKDPKVLGGQIIDDVIKSAEATARSGKSRQSSKESTGKCLCDMLSSKRSSKDSQCSKKASPKSMSNVSIEGTQKDKISATAVDKLSYDNNKNASTMGVKGSTDKMGASASKTSVGSKSLRSKMSSEKFKSSMASINGEECSCYSISTPKDKKSSKTSLVSKKDERGSSRTPSKTSKTSLGSQKSPSKSKNAPGTPRGGSKSGDKVSKSHASRSIFDKPSESKLSVLSEPTSSSSDDSSIDGGTPGIYKVWDSDSIDELVDRHVRTKMKEDILEMFKDIAKYKNKKSGKCSNCCLIDLLTTPSQKDVRSKSSLRK